jgi:hypothetical protein
MNKTILLTFILFTLGAQPAAAYIDPGTGSFILSLIGAFFVAMWLYIKDFWYKIKSFFGSSKSKKTDQN